MVKVLILMSTYNGEKYLSEQIASIFNQKDVNVKVLVRDDGSSDKTLLLLEKYKKTNQLDYISGQNINWMHSFWTLVNMARDADYYAFSDQDDIWDEDKLIRAIRMLSKYPDTPAIYCADQRIVDEKLVVQKRTEDKVDISNFTPQDFLVWGNLFRGCTEVWNNQLQEYVLSKHIEDIDEPHDSFLMHLALARGVVMKENVEVMSYRQHGSNAVGSKTGKQLWKKKLIFYLSNILQFNKNRKPYSTRCKKIYEIVERDLDQKRRNYYEQVSSYDMSWRNTLSLAFSRDYPNMTPQKRVRILIRHF